MSLYDFEQKIDTPVFNLEIGSSTIIRKARNGIETSTVFIFSLTSIFIRTIFLSIVFLKNKFSFEQKYLITERIGLFLRISIELGQYFCFFLILRQKLGNLLIDALIRTSKKKLYFSAEISTCDKTYKVSFNPRKSHLKLFLINLIIGILSFKLALYF
jgi:hypothetical protein